MMNIPPSEAERLSLPDYESILFHWNESHKGGDVEAPDPEVALAMVDRINADPRLTGPRPIKEAVH
jgi:hypothetical protein